MSEAEQTTSASSDADLNDYLRTRGLVDESVVCSARLRVVDGRLVIPWLDAIGNETYYQARSTNGAEPKYKNPTGVPRPALYASPGAYEASRVALAEGTLDALFSLQAGTVAFATAGQKFSDEAVAMLLTKDTVVLVPDHDERGAQWLAKVIGALEGRVELLVAEMPEGFKDLGEVAERADDPREAVAEVLYNARALREPDAYDFVAGDTTEKFKWQVPGVLEEKERIIITGREGHGKSVLIEQMQCQISAGIHPFGGDAIPPVKSLLVDLENSAGELRRRLGPFVTQLGTRLARDAMFVFPRPEGLDLGGEPEDQDWLWTKLVRTKAKMLGIGPLYKMTNGNPNDEQDAKCLSTFLDKLRIELGVSVIMEAHLGHNDDGGRPYGWSGWRRWPEIGLWLRESGELVHWRPSRHETPGIPPALKRGGEWPFMPATNPRDVLWGRIVEHCADRMTRPSVRDLEKSFGIHRSSIQRALDAHKEQWNEMFNE